MATKLDYTQVMLQDWPTTYMPATSHDDVHLSEIVNVYFEYEKGSNSSSALKAVMVRDIQNRVLKITSQWGLAALVSCKAIKRRFHVYGTFMDKVKIDEWYDREEDAQTRMTSLQNVHYGAGTTLYCEEKDVEVD